MKKLSSIFIVFLFFILIFASAQQAQAAKTYPIFFNSGNVGAVADKGVATRPSFTLKTQYYISAIANYHWNLGQGASQGTITVVDNKGNTIGSWESHRPSWEPSDKDRWWEVNPGKIFEPGRYTIIDSRPSTWAQNEESGGRGMSIVMGEKITETQLQAANVQLKAISGEVSVVRGSESLSAKKDMPLYVNDQINTGKNGEAVIVDTILKASAIILKEDTVVKLSSIKKAEELQKETEKALQLQLLAGNMLTIYNTAMRSAGSNIRGTKFVAEETGGRSSIRVVEGSVEFTATATGEKMLVHVGETVIANDDGLKPKQTFDAQKELAYWNDLEKKIEAKSAKLSPTQDSPATPTDKKTTPTETAPLLIGLVILFILVAAFFVIKKKH